MSTSNAALAAAAAQDADEDVVSYSLSAYNWEFSEHPDLAATWAADPPFLEHFAKVAATIPPALLLQRLRGVFFLNLP